MLHGVKQFARRWPLVGRILTDRDRLRLAHGRLQAELDQLIAERADLRAELARQCDRLPGDRAELIDERNHLRGTVACLTDERNHLRSTVADLTDERNHLRSTVADLVDERNHLRATVADLTDVRNHLQSRVADLTYQRDQLLARVKEFTGERDHALATLKEVTAQRDHALATLEEITAQRDRLQVVHDEFKEQRDRAEAAYESLEAVMDLINKGTEDWVPSGNYYSPIPSQREVRAQADTIWGEVPRTLPAVDLNEPGQLALFDELKQYYGDMPFADGPKDGLRYHLVNEWFEHGDGILLYCMLRHLRPKRVVEVGSGYTSAVMLDTNDRFFNGAMACTFIEPYPRRLMSLMRGEDRQRHRVIPQRVQDVSLDCFDALEAGDILFIDSSHVSKVGSDVNWIFFHVLPRLRPGVVVHFHDIFKGFEYPKDWVFEGRAWTESYLLRAFLQYNRAFQVLYFNSFMDHFHRDRLERDMPLCLTRAGGSIWLRKVADGA